VENITRSAQELLKMSCYVASSQIDSHYCVRNGEAFEHWANMAHAISTIKHEPTCLSSSIQAQHCLLLEEDLWRSKLFEENVCGFDSVVVWVKWWLRQENWMFLWRDFEFVKDMVPE